MNGGEDGEESEGGFHVEESLGLEGERKEERRFGEVCSGWRFA